MVEVLFEICFMAIGSARHAVDLYNLYLIGLGIVMIYLPVKLFDTKWLQVLHGTSYEVKANGIAYCLLVSGAFSIAVGCFGLDVGESNKKDRIGIYLALALGFFITLASLATWMLGTAKMADSWRVHQFPGQIEMDVARQFNMVYCRAQRDYVCNRATLNETDFAQRIFANSSSFDVDSVIAQPCYTRYSINISEVPVAVAQTCVYCLNSNNVTKYHSISKWANKNCEFNTATFGWCEKMNYGVASFERDGTISQFQDTPYTNCRQDLLHHARFWGMLGGIITVVTCVCLVLSAYYSVRLQKSKDKASTCDRARAESVEVPQNPPFPEPGIQIPYAPVTDGRVNQYN